MAAVGEAEAQQIATCEKNKGRCLLAELMNMGPYQEERNMQASMRVDFLYDQLKFAADRGFPWDQVCCVVQFAEEFLATATDKKITEAVQLYQVQSPNLLLELGERNFKMYTDFLFTTFFPHFQLYKYVLSHPRQENIPQLFLDVHPPIPPKLLTESKEKSVWRYEQTLEELENQEEELAKQRLQRQEQTGEEIRSKREAVTGSVDSVETPFTKDSLGEMMRSLLAEYAQATGQAINSSIKDVKQDLEIKLQKTSVPRPAVLGPPPRFKPKSPILPTAKPASSPSKADKKNKTNNAADKPKSPKSSARSRTGSSRASKR